MFYNYLLQFLSHCLVNIQFFQMSCTLKRNVFVYELIKILVFELGEVIAVSFLSCRCTEAYETEKRGFKCFIFVRKKIER